MICTRLNGGLGNQLFQYAAGRALAFRLGVELVLDTSTLRRHNARTTPRILELNRFRHVAKELPAHESRILPWLHRLPRFSKCWSPWQVCVERGTTFQAGFTSLADQTYLVGYWQSHRYFSEISSQLMSELQPVDDIGLSSQAIVEQIDSSESVALHVRRGDYVSLASAASFHGVLPLSYYQSALSHLRGQIIAPKVFVFSDDSDWCRANLSLESSAVVVDHNTGADAWQDLLLLARCRHHVIANSSFSWWGAWLADQRQMNMARIVIAPNRWFAHQTDLNLNDRFPAHWVKL